MTCGSLIPTFPHSHICTCSHGLGLGSLCAFFPALGGLAGRRWRPRAHIGGSVGSHICGGVVHSPVGRGSPWIPTFLDPHTCAHVVSLGVAGCWADSACPQMWVPVFLGVWVGVGVRRPHLHTSGFLHLRVPVFPRTRVPGFLCSRVCGFPCCHTPAFLGSLITTFPGRADGMTAT